ncbi:hypothetical protein NHH03_27870 [Stieleria sp. TO1_6]|uniref:hypothetical protein n=1 Tax=Stieleria tagensis TaxID=2956795 RepID=UPI00209B60EB|nr:hypothetical protein [Stieleria tagensis]MCO8125589.1 hypothetical protein [Stieleria tagensis]
MTPTSAEIARAIAFGIEHGIADYKLARTWVDNVIEQSEIADPWMLDLSFCTKNDALYLLRSVPGVADNTNVYGLLFGLAYDAHKHGHIDAWGLRDIGWRAYVDDPDASPEHWGLTLELAIETHIDGFATIVDVDTAVAETLAEIGPYADELPRVLKRG